MKRLSLLLVYLFPYIVLASLSTLVLSNCVSFRSSISSSITPLVEQDKLKNGLSLYLMRHTSPKNRCFLRLNVKVGSFHESKDENGIAHLIEHLAFENRLPDSKKELALWFQEQGMSFGSDINAYTTVDHTVFHMNLNNCEEQSIRDGLKIFHSFLNKINFDDDLIKKQKLIIDEEERHYKNSISKLNETIAQKLFAGTLFENNFVLGEKNIRNAITKEMLINFHQKFYQPSNAQIIIVGDINKAHLKNEVTTLFGKLENTQPISALDRGTPSYKEPVFIAPSSEIKSVETVFILQPKKFNLAEFNYESLQKKLSFELAISMLSESINKKSAKQADDELRPAEFYGFFDNYQQPELSLRVSSTLEDQTSAFSRAFAPLKRALDHGFSQEQFNRALNIELDNLEQSIVQESNLQSSNWAQRILNYINQRGPLSDAKTLATVSKNILKKISISDCQKALWNAFNKSNHYLFSFGDIENNEENIDKLQRILSDSLSQKSKSLKENKHSQIKFLYAVTNATAKIKKQEYFKNIDSHLVQFANGTRLIVKNLPFKKDTILLQINNDRGLASMNQMERAHMELEGSVLLNGGLKKHTWKDIGKLMQDKQLKLWFNSSLEHLSLSSVVRPKDFLFDLELTRAYITDADFNINALKQGKKQLQQNYEESKLSLGWPLQVDFPSLLSKHDPRAYRAPLSLISNISREDLLEWHRNWIKERPLSITIVGDIDVDKAIKEVGMVFGSLPKPHAKIFEKPQPITYEKNIHRSYNTKAYDEASRIIIRYPLDINTENQYLLPLAKNLIQEILWFKLREEQRAIYSPQVYAATDAYGLMQNILDVFLIAQKDKVQEIKKSAIDIIHKLAANGVLPEQLNSAKAALINYLKGNNEDLTYWLDYLTSNQNQLAKLKPPQDDVKHVEKIDLKEMNNYLKIYFLSSNNSTAIINSTTKKP
ncbi:MAG: insulinase family protein [Myxococcales bacterium]|nr:insulinase family protein [Myxococcales bacterium]USN51496.1 MAG: insulinase family protein [Myxococcales bacterium]